MGSAADDGLRRFTADALSRGIDVEVVPRPPARSLEEAAGLTRAPEPGVPVPRLASPPRRRAGSPNALPRCSAT